MRSSPAILILGMLAAAWLTPARAESATAPTSEIGNRKSEIIINTPVVVEESLALESRAGIQRGMQFLLKEQLPDGSWARHPAVTGLAALALLNAPETLRTPETTAAAGRATGWLRQRLAAEAAGRDGNYPVLNLAIGAWPMIRQQQEVDIPFLRELRKRLQAAQCLDVPADNPAYGGFRPHPGAAPDLRTTAYVLETLWLTDALNRNDAESAKRAAAGHTAALRFLTENATHPVVPCEKRKAKSENTDGVQAASMLKSLLYAGEKLDAPSITTPLNWLRREGAFERNPGVGDAGYYTYIFTLAQALRACEKQGIAEPAKGSRLTDWRRKLLEALLKRQVGDGGWHQSAPDLWETRPELTTAYALLAMELALR